MFIKQIIVFIPFFPIYIVFQKWKNVLSVLVLLWDKYQKNLVSFCPACILTQLT